MVGWWRKGNGGVVGKGKGKEIIVRVMEEVISRGGEGKGGMLGGRCNGELDGVMVGREWW